MKPTQLLLCAAIALPACLPGHAPAENAAEMNGRVVQLLAEGRYPAAVELATKQLELTRPRAAEDPRAHAASLHNLGEAHQRAGAYDKAEPLLLEARDLRAKIAGGNDPDYATTLNSLALLYDAKGAYQQAEELLLKVKDIRAAALGENHPAYADTLGNLGSLYDTIGAPEKAEPLYRQALDIKARVSPDGDPGYACLLNNLAILDELAGSYDKAEAGHLEALRMRAKVLGKDHPDYAQSLCNLAGVYRITGAYQKSEELFLEAKELRAATLGRDHPDYALALGRLATLYQAMGEHGKSEAMFLESKAIQTRTLGADHPACADTLNNLAQLYQSMGAYEKAEPLYQTAVAILAKAHGKDNAKRATPLGNLGALYMAMGAHDKAEPLLLEAKQIEAARLGEDHPDYALTLNNLAALYVAIRACEKAEPLYQQAMRISAARLGTSHPYYAANLCNLAELYQVKGDYGRAEPLYRQGIDLLAKSLGEDHPFYPSSLANLAALYHAMGAHEKGIPLLVKASALLAKSLGQDHPQYAASLSGLATLHLAMNEPDLAAPLAQELEPIQRRLLGRVFAAFPEQDRVAYVQSLGLHDLPCSLASGPLAATSAIAFKGAVCASVLEELRLLRAAADPQAEALVTRLGELRQRFHRMTLQGNRQEAERLFGRIDEDEKKLARFVSGLDTARKSLLTRLADVQQALPANAALVEILRYKRPLHAANKPRQWDERYGAVVIRHEGEPAFVRLAPAAEIDQAVQRLRAMAEAPPAADADARCQDAARQLYQLLLAPLEAAVGDAGTLVLSPDSQLHFLSFEPLLDASGRMACEKWQLRMIDTGRDLLEETSRADDHKSALLLGDPAFGTAGETGGQPGIHLADNRGIFVVESNLKLGMQGDLSGISFHPLPGTRAEVGALDELLRRSGWEPRLLADQQASEPVLREQIKGRKIVHLATHGFFLNQLEPGREESPDGIRFGAQQQSARPAQDPMVRSGLALAGANRTLAAWRQGEVPTPANDGLLTAAEAATLDLGGTQLVVLSACETAAGKALDGEGIYGLRRALKLAGADTVVMTLWPVSDLYTGAFMNDFYQRFVGGRHPAVALAETKRDHLVKLRAEVGLHRAIQLVGPFTATGKGIAAVRSAD